MSIDTYKLTSLEEPTDEMLAQWMHEAAEEASRTNLKLQPDSLKKSNRLPPPSDMYIAEHRPVLIIIAGPNGSGKTTITSKILKHEWMEGAVYINPDNVAQERFGDWNSPEAVMQAAQFCENQREQCLLKGQSLIFETVLSSEGKVDFIRRAREAGYFIRLFFVSTNHPSINSSRIAKRVMKGGHDVPIPKIISRYQKSLSRCRYLATKVQRTYLYDNSIEDTDAKLLVRFADGCIVKRYVDQLPEWAIYICDE